MTPLPGWSDIDRPAIERRRRDLHATNRPVMPTPMSEKRSREWLAEPTMKEMS